LELSRAFRDALAISAPAVWAPRVPDEELLNPYKGLRAFEETDAGDFFGREALVEQLLGRMGKCATYLTSIICRFFGQLLLSFRARCVAHQSVMVGFSDPG
jgi:hypothetical protein